MSQNTPRCAPALLYAVEPAQIRDAVTEVQRNNILKEAYAHGEFAPAVGLDVLRSAEMLWLARHPFTDPDRLGRYASRLLENYPPQAIVFCLFDAKRRLLKTHLLVSGPAVDLTQFCPQIPILYQNSGAAYGALFFAPRADEYGYTGEDDRLASRMTLYCKQQHVPLLDCIVAWFNGYVSLFRKYGYTP